MGRNPLVMIIDEDPIFRQELQAMLTPARLAVVADCGYGVEAASLAEELSRTSSWRPSRNRSPGPSRRSRRSAGSGRTRRSSPIRVRRNCRWSGK
ncbi:MAG: hypothetical protein M5U18_01075 [Dehalococcoidia bacterium]|nr:hypothetical protein [Dehalococcoidia bacterium]